MCYLKESAIRMKVLCKQGSPVNYVNAEILRNKYRIIQYRNRGLSMNNYK